MRIKTLLLLAASLTVSVLKAEDYQIHSVEPDTMTTGNNTLEITLNKENVDYDSIVIHFNGTTYNDQCDPDSISWVDSVITAKVLIPSFTSSQDVDLGIELINTTDWSHEALIYAGPFYIKEVLFPPTYNIQHVEPNYLIPGSDNIITVTLNKEILASDSANISILGYTNGVLANTYNPNTCSTEIDWIDSTITINIDIPDLSQNEKGVLHLEMINEIDLSNQILVYEDSLLIGGNIHSIMPEICMVSVDSSNKNIIIWEPDYEEYIDSIIIYKETTVADEFEIIGRKSIEETSIFVDEESENASNSNRYKIAFQDTSGIVSKMSPPHKTMHLTMNVGVNRAINLIWEQYEGFDYSTFHIYRGSSRGEMLKIAEIASNLFTFTDQNPSLFNLYYQVVIERPEACDITSNKSTENTYSSTRSNIVEHAIVSNSTLEQTEYFINIYPNPATNNIIISVDNLLHNEFDVVIHDLTGRSIQSHLSLRNGSNIDLSELKSGMYLLTVTSNGINQNKIIIKE